MKTMEELQNIQERMLNRYDMNINFFKQFIPDVYKQIEETNELPNFIIDQADGHIDIIIDNEKLYSENSAIFSRNEAVSFLELMNKKDYTPQEKILHLFHMIKENPFKNTTDLYSKNKITTNPETFETIIFGCGLGYHIEIITNRKVFSHITIIEKNPIIFKASLFTVNWKDILENMGNKRALTFMIKNKNESENEFIRKIEQNCYQQFPSTYIATIIYNHYKKLDDYAKIKESIIKFTDFMKVISERIGPEAHRLLNANENIRNNEKVINLNKVSFSEKNTNIAIIGGGPSLDIYYEVLKKHREKFFIISAGSGLSSILNLGIKPDIHFELEYQHLSVNILEHVSKNHDISDLDVICTYEGNPGYQKYFRKTYLYVPNTSELINLFRPENILIGGGITCTNSAAAFACRISNNDIYFFGMDFAHTNGMHHSKTNISQEKNLPESLKAISGSSPSNAINSTTISTLGKLIPTKIPFESARKVIEDLAEHMQNKIYNCSHGASIKNTSYISIEELDEKLSNLKTNIRPAIEIETTKVSYKIINQYSTELIESSIRGSNNIIKAIKNTNPSSFEIGYKIKEINHSLMKQYMRSPGELRNIMSFNRFPLLVLFITINYSTSSATKEILESWIKEQTEFLKYTEEKILSKLKDKNHFIEEEWTDH